MSSSIRSSGTASKIEFERTNKAGRKEVITTIRYWQPYQDNVVLRPEYYLGKTYEVTVPQIQWVARVLRPVRRIKIVDATPAD